MFNVVEGRYHTTVGIGWDRGGLKITVMQIN